MLHLRRFNESQVSQQINQILNICRDEDIDIYTATNNSCWSDNGSGKAKVMFDLLNVDGDDFAYIRFHVDDENISLVENMLQRLVQATDIYIKIYTTKRFLNKVVTTDNYVADNYDINLQQYFNVGSDIEAFSCSIKVDFLPIIGKKSYNNNIIGEYVTMLSLMSMDKLQLYTDYYIPYHDNVITMANNTHTVGQKLYGNLLFGGLPVETANSDKVITSIEYQQIPESDITKASVSLAAGSRDGLPIVHLYTINLR